jgi:Zn-dependent M16 (insulinase) family peptidase/DNA-nicking Smr family endonuclease
MNHGSGGKPAKGGRRMTPDEAALWQQLTHSLDKVKTKPRVATHGGDAAMPAEPAAPAPQRPAASRNRAAPAAAPPPVAPPPSPAKPPRPGEFDRRTLRQVAGGKVPIDATLDLHGLHQNTAHARLRAFLMSCQAKGQRMVLVITGKGGSSLAPDLGSNHGRGGEGSDPLPWRAATQRPAWLEEPELRARRGHHRGRRAARRRRRLYPLRKAREACAPARMERDRKEDMAIVHGFELIGEQALPEANSTVRRYRHVKTGADLLSFVNDDENKVFGIAFRTPPPDSTGLPHILEHSVLCGSRKYPVKDPFIQLAKGSLNTFLNAMTYPDKTVYPTASQNLQDFYNLVDVYLDAVFHPRIGPEVLMQEGWHFELDKPDAPMTYKGVVFNEMKGVYSSPDALLNKLSQESLFPDNEYGVDSGGDPRHIPELTYANFKAFHETYYHPSNARIYFYGNDDPEERLRLLDAYLSEFGPAKIDAPVALQARFSAPKHVARTFPATDADTKSQMAVNWMLDEIGDVERDLGLAMLGHILLGTPASPLRKALMDSGLCEDAGGGFDEGLRQTVMGVGLRGTEASNTGKIEALILDTLERLSNEGIDKAAIEASLNTFEFSLRERNTGSFPRGLALMLHALSYWLHGRDPLAPLAFEAPLALIKARIAGNERYFEDLIQRHLLANPHRTTSVVSPDTMLGQKEAAEEQGRLAAARGRMDGAEVEAVVESTRTLKLAQEKADTPEALATIPSLTLADLPRHNPPIPRVVTEVAGTRVLFHEQPTNGIVYVDLGLDLHTLPPDLVSYVELLGRALLETGAGDQDFVALSQRIGRFTGGIRARPWTSSVTGSEIAAARLFLRTKVMPDRVDELMSILTDVLKRARLDNRERISQIVMEEKSQLESSLPFAGSRYAALRLRSGISEAAWAAEQMGGVAYLSFLRGLADKIARDWSGVQATLERVRDILVRRGAMICNVTADAALWARFEPRLAEFLRQLPDAPAAAAAWPAPAGPRSEGLTIPAKVNYVVKGGDLRRLGAEPTGAAAVVQHYLHHLAVEQGARAGRAYGGSCASTATGCSTSRPTATRTCWRRSTPTTRRAASCARWTSARRSSPRASSA